MTRASLQALHIKRGQIIERIAYERAIFFQKTEPLARALARIDHAQSVAEQARAFIYRHPFLLTGVSVLAFFKKPRFFLRLFYQGFLLWRLSTQFQEKRKTFKNRAMAYLRTYFQK